MEEEEEEAVDAIRRKEVNEKKSGRGGILAREGVVQKKADGLERTVARLLQCTYTPHEDSRFGWSKDFSFLPVTASILVSFLPPSLPRFHVCSSSLSCRVRLRERKKISIVFFLDFLSLLLSLSLPSRCVFSIRFLIL